MAEMDWHTRAVDACASERSVPLRWKMVPPVTGPYLVGVGVRAEVRVGVGVRVRAGVGLGLGVGAGVGVGVTVGAQVGVVVGVGVEVGVGSWGLALELWAARVVDGVRHRLWEDAKLVEAA